MWFSAALLAMVCAARGTAQVTTGSISGYVFDSSGRAVAQAAASVSNQARSFERTASVNQSGLFQIAELPPGVYVATVTAKGFETAIARNIRVEVNGNVRLDFHPRVAGPRESVTVTAEVGAPQADSPERGTVLGRDLISRLPLNERDFLQLSLLTSGVLPPVQDSALSTRGNFSMHANGGREEFNNFLLDGVDNNDPDTNRYVLQPSVDAIEEFKIATNSYSAEYGRSAGGQVNVITRSGTNAWHGFAYEYFRNRNLDARNFFDGTNKPQFVRNQFGAGLGGPLRRNRLFLFADYDGLSDRVGFSRLATVPTIAERAGDLSGRGKVNNPFTQAPFPNKQIPASLISPIALKILNLYPLPDTGGAGGNYLAQPVGRDSLNQFNIRTDYRLNDRNQFTVRYSYGYKNIFEPYAEQSLSLPGFGDYLQDRGHNALINYSHIFTPRAINTLLLGFNRAARRDLSQNYQTDVNQLWGVNYLPTRPIEFGYPAINVLGYSLAGDVVTLPIDRHTNTYQLTDGITLIRGSHSISLGAEFRKIELNGIVDVYPRGQISFQGALSGSGIGDLLLGLPSFGIQSYSTAPQTLRTFASNFYAQDSWKVTPRLTLSLGLRYEYNTPPTDPTNRMSTLNLATGQLTQVGQNGVSRSGIRPDRNNLGPRAGFAWNAAGNLVIRGGYGVFYDSGALVQNSALYYNPPYYTIEVFFPTATSLLTLQNPFPKAAGVVPPASLSLLSPDLRTAYLQDWNMTVERTVDKVGKLSASYSGSKGTHLIRTLDLNQPAPGAANLTARRPYKNFANIFFTGSGSNSSFHSLQLGYSRPLARGLSVLANYMWSKSIDDTSAYLGTTADRNFPQNSANYAAERAPSSFDITSYGTAAVVYAVPGKAPWIRNTEARAIVTAHSGQAFTPVLSTDNSNTGNTGGNFGSDRPNVSGSVSLANPGPAEWFNTAAFWIPSKYTFGNAGRNILRGPGLATLDFALARRFTLRERIGLSFEAQAFNLLNRTNFDLPQLYADQPSSFGRIFSAKASRQIQFSLRLSY